MPAKVHALHWTSQVGGVCAGAVELASNYCLLLHGIAHAACWRSVSSMGVGITARWSISSSLRLDQERVSMANLVRTQLSVYTLRLSCCYC